MTTTKNQKVLILLALFSLSLLAIAPLASNTYAYSNSTSLFPNTISAKAPLENLTTGQTWYYKLTFTNATDYSNHSFIYSQKYEGIVNITDWGLTTQQCYKLTTKINIVKLYKIVMGLPIPSGVSMQQISSMYLNATDYSIPQVDSKFVSKYSGMTFQDFTRRLFNESVYLYQLPLSDGQLWTNLANTSITGWNMTTPSPGINITKPELFTDIFIDASVSGPMSVTVPAGTYEAYQINYTGALYAASILFGEYAAMIGGFGYQIESWYSLDAQNFVKFFIDGGYFGNVTIELVPKPSELPMIPLLFILYNSGLQQQGSSRLLLIGGGVAAALAVAVIAIVLLRRH